MKKTVILNFLGTTLDSGTADNRWKRWRPTVALGQFPDLLVDRIELFTTRRSKSLTKQIVADLAEISPETEVREQLIEPRDPWNFEEVFEALFQFARDYDFDLDREEYLVNITTGTHVAQICLFLLTESRHFPARLLQLSPPRGKTRSREPGEYAIIDLDLSRYDRLAERFRRESEEGSEFLKSGIATKNRAFNDMIDRIEKVAIRSTAPILLAGPTGAGKTRLARRIYDLKRQRNQVEGPFVELNCSTLRGDTAMSTLFGHRKGAFTGASSARAGLLKSADRGVLFLDEIGELGLDEQSMLLRAMEEKRFLPVGSDREETSDFQLLSGTNRDLIDDVASGKFRADLFARLNLWLFELPGLRERREDIEPNIEFELSEWERKTGRRVAFNREGYEAFLRFAKDPASAWSGNFRDLNAAIVRMATLTGDHRIGTDLVEEESTRLHRTWSVDIEPEKLETRSTLESVLSRERIAEIDPFDQVQLAEVIRVCRNSRSLSEAGRELFSASRKRRKAVNDSDRVRKYLARFGLDWASVSDR